MISRDDTAYDATVYFRQLCMSVLEAVGLLAVYALLAGGLTLLGVLILTPS